MVDFDIKKGAAADLDAIEAVIERLPLVPTDRVVTPNGVHAYWRLREPMLTASSEERELAAAMVKGWERYVRDRAGFHVDATADLARIMRLPGSLHRKPHSDGARLVVRSGLGGPRYNGEDVEPYILTVVGTTASNGKDVHAALTVHTSVAMPSWFDTVREVAGPRFAGMCSGEVEMPSPSERDLSIASALVGLAPRASDQDITDVLVALRKERGDDTKPSNAQYYRRTVAKAREPRPDSIAATPFPCDQTCDPAAGLGDTISMPHVPVSHGGLETVRVPEHPRGVFPLDALPGPIADFVAETAAALRVPIDMVAVPALGFMAAAVGGSLCIELNPEWREHPVLWLAVVARPGTKKTPAIAAAGRPIEEWQSRLFHEHREAQDRYEIADAAWASTRNRDRGPKPDKPMGERVVVDDTTIEKLAVIHEQNPRGLIVNRDELTAWVRGLGQYKARGGSDRQQYLSMWSSKQVVVDRVKNPVPIVIRKPIVSVLGSIQPDMLAELRDPERRDDGFTDRILFAYPQVAGGTAWTDDTVDPRTANRYAAVLQRMLAVPMCAGLYAPESTIVRLSPEARQVWVDHHNAHAVAMNDPDLPPRLYGVYSKASGYAARIALILHAAAVASEESERGYVDTQAVLGGWAIMNYYFLPNARSVYGFMGQRADDRQVDALVAWLRRRGGSASVRDMVRGAFNATSPGSPRTAGEWNPRPPRART